LNKPRSRSENSDSKGEGLEIGRDPDLAQVVAAWTTLTESTRQRIITLIEAEDRTHTASEKEHTHEA
jgi:hypothetical protein